MSEFIKGKYQDLVNLGPKLNTEYHEWDTYTAPDDGLWSEPVHMGNEINTDKSENRPYVSPDEKYFFYTSNKRGNRDIYWVDATIIEKLKSDELK